MAFVRAFSKWFVVWLLLHPAQVSASNLTVGPGKLYTTIRAAALAVQPGDTVTVDPGSYVGDVATWNKANLLVRAAVPSNRPHLIAVGMLENLQGVWRVSSGGTNCTFDGFEIEGAAYPNTDAGNGAAIRVESSNTGWVAIRNCYFHDNQMNIEAAPDSLLVENCELDHTTPATVCDPVCRVGYEHDIYVNLNSCRVVVFRYNYVHRAADGNDFKSRARTTYLLYNRIADEFRGDGHEPGYTVDIPDGGRCVAIGNIIEQGPGSPNTTIFSFGAESSGNTTLDLYAVNNTFVNDQTSGGVFIYARSGTTAKVYNNIFYGPGAMTSGTGATFTTSNNVQYDPKTNQPAFVDPTYDFHLTSSTPIGIVNAGLLLGKTVTGFDLTPTQQYVYNTSSQARPTTGLLDLGAFELSGTTDTVVDSTQSYFVPQAGPLDPNPGVLEGAAAIAYHLTCPNNDLLTNGARLKVVLRNAFGAPISGVPAANIFAQFNGGTVGQGFTGPGADSIYANSAFSPIAHCPDVRFIPADDPTDAAGVAYIYWKGRGGVRDPMRKWGGYQGNIPIYANGVHLYGRLTTLDANGTYTAHVKNVDSVGSDPINQGEVVNILDYNPVFNAVGGGPAPPYGPYTYKWDYTNNGYNGLIDLQFVIDHMNHRCDYPLNP